LLQQLTKALVERALQGELTHHLGYTKHAPEGKTLATRATAPRPRPSKVSGVKLILRCHVTATVSLNRN
jgi:transposase-like protein